MGRSHHDSLSQPQDDAANSGRDDTSFENGGSPHLTNQSSPIIGAMTAGGRSMVYQLTSFYLRTPLKLFRPARFDYMHYLRVLLTGDDKVGASNEQQYDKQKSLRYRFWNPKYTYYLENSSIGIVTKALNKYGWKVLPDRVLPPLLANSATGVILYTTYLTSLNHFSSNTDGNNFQVWNVLRAGFLAGVAQAIASAPIDAIYTRSSVNDFLSSAKKYNNLWLYGRDKLKEIGLVGCFGGFGLSLVKESIGFAVYFTTFETLKGQICDWTINFVKNYRELKYTVKHTKLSDIFQDENEEEKLATSQMSFMSRKEEKWFHTTFLFVGGVTAAFLLQLVQYPFLKLQKIHFSRLEAFDIYNKAMSNSNRSIKKPTSPTVAIPPKSTKIRVSPGNQRLFHIYYNSYLDTFQHVYFIHKNTGAVCRWLYKGFVRNTLAIIPGTTAGLLLLEYMRNRLIESVAPEGSENRNMVMEE